MSKNKLYVCLEAKDDNNKPVYLIYSVKLRNLRDSSPPKFTRVAVITGGVRSMGCGFFNSKIVLAGGLLEENEKDRRNKGLITYDFNSKVLSGDDIPMMRGGKVSPLVFQHNNKLYVLDTGDKLHRRSFEVYFPNQRHWHRLYCPFRNVPVICSEQSSFSEGISRYSWFVFGQFVCLSLPEDTTYIHHAKDYLRSFDFGFNEALPFRGMATTYYEAGFKDVVVISFSEGLVEGRRFLMSSSDYFEKPVLLVDTRIHSPHYEDMSGCFADFGNGNFCLTTFDKVNIHVYKFKISRQESKEDEDLNLKLSKFKMHKYNYKDFSTADYRSFRFVGCFAPPQNDWSKERAEAALYRSHYPLSRGEEEDDDDIPGIKVCLPLFDYILRFKGHNISAVYTQYRW